MTTPSWQPGTLYLPGAVVRPNSLPAVVAQEPVNKGFEDGDTGWTKEAHWTIAAFANPFSGTYCARCRGAVGDFSIYSATPVAAVAGMILTASCKILRGDNGCNGKIFIEWLDSGMYSLAVDYGNLVNTGEDKWKGSSVTSTAPATTAYVRIGVKAHLNDNDVGLFCDAFQWNYAYQPPIDSLVYKAVQAASGYSAGTEPVWPGVLGQTVVDNEVTWEAIDSSTVTWEAFPILVSGATEPTFPTEIGATVSDNTIVWEAISRRVEDEKCPNTGVLVIAASKIFCADDDIVAFSATVNPLDWSTADDAGYLPFGMQAYGSRPVKALGLYRGNVVAFNEKSFQMWQVDPDPQNMALLDTVPVGTIYHESLQPFQNDLVFLSPVGVRNMAIAGASTNLQAGAMGKPVDPLVKSELAAATYIRSCYVPTYGQYWLAFSDYIVMVLTINGVKEQSWSRYRFPRAIKDTAIHEGDLYLRMDNDVILVLDDYETADDIFSSPATPVLEVTPGSGLVAELSWTVDDPYNADIDYFVVLRADGTDALLVEIAHADGSSTTYTDSDVALVAGTEYRYALVAIPFDADAIPAEVSNEATITF